MQKRTFTAPDAGTRRHQDDVDRLAAARLREDRRWRRARALGVIGTVLFHLLLFLIFRPIVVPISPSSAAGPAMGDLRAAEGGSSGLTMVEVRPQRPPEEEVVEREIIPVPEIVVEPVEVEPPPSPDPSPPASAPSLPGVEAPGPGGETGSATGPGTSTGTGQGGGGTGDEGASAIVPPTPRGVFIPPPGRPASARGQEITVWVFVTEAGRVDRGTVRLEPPTSDSRYNQRLIQSVAEWVFEPARREGRPVSTWYPFQIIL